jgi:hypothetical protein
MRGQRAKEWRGGAEPPFLSTARVANETGGLAMAVQSACSRTCQDETRAGLKQFANEATTPQYVMDFNYWLYDISVAS